MEKIYEEHLINIKEYIKVIHAELQNVWGNKFIHVKEMNIIDKEEIKVDNLVISTVWLKIDVYTSGYNKGSHLVKLTIKHSGEVTTEEYIQTIYKSLKINGDKRGSYYTVEDGEVYEEENLTGVCVVTFSDKAFLNELLGDQNVNKVG